MAKLPLLIQHNRAFVRDELTLSVLRAADPFLTTVFLFFPSSQSLFVPRLAFEIPFFPEEDGALQRGRKVVVRNRVPVVKINSVNRR